MVVIYGTVELSGRWWYVYKDGGWCGDRGRGLGIRMIKCIRKTNRIGMIKRIHYYDSRTML